MSNKESDTNEENMDVNNTDRDEDSYEWGQEPFSSAQNEYNPLVLIEENKMLLSKLKMDHSEVKLASKNIINPLYSISVVFLTLFGIGTYFSGLDHNALGFEISFIIGILLILAVGSILLVFCSLQKTSNPKHDELRKNIVYYQKKMLETGSYIRKYYASHPRSNSKVFTEFSDFQNTLYSASIFLISFKSEKVYNKLIYDLDEKNLKDGKNNTRADSRKIQKILDAYIVSNEEYCKILRRQLGGIEVRLQKAITELGGGSEKNTEK